MQVYGHLEWKEYFRCIVKPIHRYLFQLGQEYTIYFTHYFSQKYTKKFIKKRIKLNLADFKDVEYRYAYDMSYYMLCSH